MCAKENVNVSNVLMNLLVTTTSLKKNTWNGADGNTCAHADIFNYTCRDSDRIHSGTCVQSRKSDHGGYISLSKSLQFGLHIKFRMQHAEPIVSVCLISSRFVLEVHMSGCEFLSVLHRWMFIPMSQISFKFGVFWAFMI